jgi:adenosylcobinamide-GDP ribazoletransferase
MTANRASYSGIRASYRGARAALTFLTRLPLPRSTGGSGRTDDGRTDDGRTDDGRTDDSADLAHATVFFPLVGTLVGAIGAGVYWLATMLWPPTVAVILAVAATILVTGALHEDALADFADGFGGGWSPEQVLAIMKDSRVGAYGVVALTLAILAKLAALATLTRLDVVRALLAAHTIARWATLPLLAWLPYVRPEGGTTTPFVGGVTPLRLSIATACMLLVLAATLGPRAIPIVLAAIVITAASAWYTRRRIGGITGDVMGATAQCLELATYLILAARIP